jgi:hypothetical protein
MVEGHICLVGRARMPRGGTHAWEGGHVRLVGRARTPSGGVCMPGKEGTHV